MRIKNILTFDLCCIAISNKMPGKAGQSKVRNEGMSLFILRNDETACRGAARALVGDQFEAQLLAVLEAL